MTEANRNEVKHNPNLGTGSERWPRERKYVARLAQWREDLIVTRAVEQELAAVAAGRVVVSAGGYF